MRSQIPRTSLGGGGGKGEFTQVQTEEELSTQILEQTPRTLHLEHSGGGRGGGDIADVLAGPVRANSKTSTLNPLPNLKLQSPDPSPKTTNPQFLNRPRYQTSGRL